MESGTFQGSPLSPLLCILFLVDLINHINDSPDSVFRGADLPWSNQAVASAIKILLFADDIAIPAESIKELQAALHIITEWANRRQVRFSVTKSKIMCINRAPTNVTPLLDLPPLFLHGQALRWVSSYKYLGFTLLEAPAKYKRLSTTTDYDTATANTRLYGMRTLFRNKSHRQALVPSALRIGIHQVVHAKALYPTAILDIHYQNLDVRVNGCLRDVFNMPLQCSATYLRRELGIWPSKFYAHRRALRFAWKLHHEHWTKPAFQHLSRATHLPPVYEDTWVPGGVLTRLSRILGLYGLTWKNVYRTSDWDKWSERIHQALSHALNHLVDEWAHHYGFPHTYKAITSFQPPLPSYLEVGGDLACAGLRFRYARLRSLPYRDPTNHGTCRFCQQGPENGHHLLHCTSLPDDLNTHLLQLCQAITQEAHRHDRHFRPLSALYALQWPRQTKPLLIRVLAFMRTVINRYVSTLPAPEEDASFQTHFPIFRVRRIRSSPPH